LIYRAGSVFSPLHSRREFSLEHLVSSLVKSMTDYGEPILWTAAIAATTAGAIAFLAPVAAWFAWRSKRWAAGGIWLIVAASMAFPYPLVGVWLDSCLSAVPIERFRELCDRNIFGPALATTWLALGPGTLIVYFALRQTSQTALDAMTTERARGWTLFWSWGVMARWPVVLATAGMGALLAAGDVATSFQVLPPGIDTLPRAIQGQLHSGVDDLTAAISLVGFAATWATGLSVSWLLRRDRRPAVSRLDTSGAAP
jgi:ABC-type spermidine/putrescine transport system permease subunit II